jgi:hypothetical protein
MRWLAVLWLRLRLAIWSRLVLTVLRLWLTVLLRWERLLMLMLVTRWWLCILLRLWLAVLLARGWLQGRGIWWRRRLRGSRVYLCRGRCILRLWLLLLL